MLFGLDPVTLSAAYILVSSGANSPCPPQGRIEVDVQLVRNERPLVTSLSSQQLTQQFGHDPDSTLSTDGHWMVGGVTVVSGDGLTSRAGAQFDSRKNTRTGEVCFVVKSVSYTINYTPQIYIASDFMNLGCRYSATLMHEKRHVETDARTITDYIPRMRSDIERFAESIGPQGPFSEDAAQARSHEIVQQIGDGLKPVWDQLLALRRQRQAAIDTEENYRRDTAVCPGQFPQFNPQQ